MTATPNNDSSGRPPPLLFATADHRSARDRAFGILPNDLLRHVLVIGPTGTGKTTLLERFAIEQIERGHGLAVIDPHGDLAVSLRGRIPRRRKNDLMYFDPADPKQALPINLLEHGTVEERVLVVAGTIGVFARIFPNSWGPRLEATFRYALFAVLETRGATLPDVQRLLSDDDYRGRVVSRLKDDIIRDYFEREFERYPPAFRAEVIAPVQNKLAAALTSPVLRRILGVPRSGFSCRSIMDRGGILIANLSKGRIGDDAARFLGAMITTKFQLAALSRADLVPADRRQFTLYADEFATYVTQSFAELSAEARKYSLGLVLATQSLAQIDEPIRRTIMGNVGTKIAFRLASPEDAKILGAEFEPEITAHDLMRLSRHQIALRLCVDGVTGEAFTAKALNASGTVVAQCPASSSIDSPERGSRV